MNRIKSQVGVAVLLAAMFVAAGCGTTPGSKFVSYQDTWDVTYAAYKAHCERVVQGKVSAENEALADAAWNQFRVTFKESLVAFKGTMQSPTPMPIKEAARKYQRLVLPPKPVKP